MTVTDKHTVREKLNINHKNTHINTIHIKENKQLNIQQKQNYPGLVASYDSRPENEVGLFNNGPEHPHGPKRRLGAGKQGGQPEKTFTLLSHALQYLHSPKTSDEK